jgi:hypothetical protein
MTLNILYRHIEAKYENNFLTFKTEASKELLLENTKLSMLSMPVQVSWVPDQRIFRHLKEKVDMSLSYGRWHEKN